MPSSLIFHIVVPLGLGQLAGLLSTPKVATYYKRLRKPDWRPPVLLFPVIWSCLYALMGWAAHRVFAAGAGRAQAWLYVSQLALNLSWQPVFFNFESLSGASAVITALLPVLAATIVSFYQVDPTAGLALLPYFFFSIYAAALTYKIKAMNQHSPGTKPAAA